MRRGYSDPDRGNRFPEKITLKQRDGINGPTQLDRVVILSNQADVPRQSDLPTRRSDGFRVRLHRSLTTTVLF
jgi:hypothetical protein